jgi:adenine-specific DNA glycosylase
MICPVKRIEASKYSERAIRRLISISEVLFSSFITCMSFVEKEKKATSEADIKEEIINNTNAKQIVSDFGGVFPSDYKTVLSLKGIGEYTAAAIVSFAWNQPYAVVDGNVYRVLSRLFAVETPIDTTKGKKAFNELATHLLDKRHAGEHNQAVMEFGALYCMPRHPDCAACIFTDECVAYAKGQVDLFPIKQGKTKVRHRFLNYFHIKNGQGTFVRKRPAGDIWQGLYEFPMIETEQPVDFVQIQQTAAFQALFEGSEGLTFHRMVPEIRHVLSHQVLHAVFYELEVTKAGTALLSYLCIPDRDLEVYAVPRLLHIYWEKRGGKLAE